MLQFFRVYPSLFAAAPEIVQPLVAQMNSALAEPDAAIGQRLVAQLRYPSDAPTIGLILCR
jgi:hypothetical protein